MDNNFETVPYKPPDHTLPNSLTVVENFFQQELNKEVITAVRTLPDDQATELRLRIGHEAINSTQAWYIRQDKLEHTPPQFSGYQHIIQPEIHIHEQAILHAGVRTDIANIGALKYLALYCERTYLRDPLPGPEDLRPIEQWREAAADGLEQLLPILPLVRDGSFLLGYLARTTLPELRRRLLTIEKSLPQYAAKIRAYDDLTFTDLISIAAADERLTLLLAKAQPQLTAEEMCDITVYSDVVRECNLTPITSDPNIAHGYAWMTQRLLGGTGASSWYSSDRDTAISPAAQYHIPSLAGVDLNKIIKLRQETFFGDLRQALVTLDAHCAQANIPDNYQAYKGFVKEAAEDIVGPTYASLLAIQKRAKLQAALGFGAGKLVRLGLHAVGKGGFLPGAGAVAGPADKVVKKTVYGKRQAQKEAVETGLGILKSILPADFTEK